MADGITELSTGLCIASLLVEVRKGKGVGVGWGYGTAVPAIRMCDWWYKKVPFELSI
jgi:hypothetical protein